MHVEMKSMSCKNYSFQAQQIEMIHIPGSWEHGNEISGADMLNGPKSIINRK